MLWVVAKSISHHRSESLISDDSPVNTNQQWFPMVSKWCRLNRLAGGWKGVVTALGVSNLSLKEGAKLPGVWYGHGLMERNLTMVFSVLGGL